MNQIDGPTRGAGNGKEHTLKGGGGFSRRRWDTGKPQVVESTHTRARRWQHCVPKPLRSPLAKPRRYANKAAGAAHASLLRGDPGVLELRRKWACEAGLRGDVPGSGEQSHTGLSAGRGTGCICHRTALDGTEESPLYASGQYRRPQGNITKDCLSKSL